MSQFLSEYVWLPLWEASKRYPIRKSLSFLKNASCWSREELDNYRNQRVQALVQHAYEKVPYYRNVMSQFRLTPHDVRTVDDLNKFPILSRPDLQQYKDELLSDGFDMAKCKRGASSGSTGEPVVFYHDRMGEAIGWASIYFSWMQVGWRFGDRNVTLWGNPTTAKEDWARFTSRLKSWLMEQHRFPSYLLLNGVYLDKVLDEIYSLRPDFLDGYASSIYVLALRARERGFRYLGCRGVFTTAESLFDNHRQAIETIFGPVFDQYGCSEINGIAFQCQMRSGYHILEPHVIVEFEDIGLGDVKALLVTDLDNYVMPLIRYRCGDLATSSQDEKCVCGLQFRMLKQLAGRQNDLIRTPKGGYFLVPSFLGGKIFKKINSVRQHQVVLRKDGIIEVRLVTEGKLSPDDQDLLHNYLSSYLQDVITFEVKLVPEIPLAPNGKMKLFMKE